MYFLQFVKTNSYYRNLILLNLLIKLPGLFNSLDPYLFCDEFLYWDEVHRLLENNSLVINWFKSGNLNILPVTLALLPVEYFFNFLNLSINYSNFTVLFARFLFNFILSSLSIIYLLKINTILGFTKSKYSNFTLGILFILNPYIFAQSRIWYADSYLLYFTILLSYFILKNYYKKSDQKQIIFLFIVFALGISIKYNFSIIGIAILFVFIKKLFNKQILIHEIFIGFLFFLLTLLLINYSIFINFQQFISDFNFNLNNYGDFNISNVKLNFLYYLIFLYIVPINVFGFLFLVLGIFEILKVKKYFTFFYFIIFPLFYILFISNFEIVVNRNINLFTPFILICFNLGIEKTFNNKKFPIKVNFTFFIVIYLTSFSVTFIDDLRIDSRISANKWLSEQSFLYNEEIGINEYCSGESPAKDIGLLFKDKYGKLDLNYYVINEYWENSFLNIDNRINILFVLNHKNDHFYYFDNQNILEKNFTSKLTFESDLNYRLIKTFQNNGPTIYIFQKK